MTRALLLCYGFLGMLLTGITGCTGPGGVRPVADSGRADSGIDMRACQTFIGVDDKSLSKRQKQARVHLDLGLGYLAEDVLETAKENLDKALSLDPKLARGYAAQALLNIRMKEFAVAGENYRRAFGLAPGDPEINQNYGLYLCSQNQYGQADSHFRCAIANPTYATPELAYYNAGRCALVAAKPEQAVNDFDNALALAPKMRAARLLLADAQYRLGNARDAEIHFRRFAERGNLTPAALSLGIKIYRELGDLDKVASYSLVLRNKFPDSEEARQFRR